MRAKAGPRAPMAAMMVGTVTPSCDSDAAGSKMLTLTTYRPRVVDLGRLDGLSPPWMRLGSKLGAPPDPEMRPRGYVEAYAKLLRSYMAHKAAEATAKLMALPAPPAREPTVTVRLMADPMCGGQIAISCTARFEGDDDAEQGGLDADARKALAELASAWGNLFIRGAMLPLAKGGVAPAEWEGFPQGLPRAAVEMALNGASSSEALARWAPALLALEQSLALSGSKLGKAKASAKSSSRKAL